MKKLLLCFAVAMIAVSCTLPPFSVEDYKEHGDCWKFLHGFLNGTALFENVTRSDECLAILPVLHDGIADIIEIIRHIHEGDIFDNLRKIIDKLEEMNDKMKTVEEPCKAMCGDIRARLCKLRKYLKHHTSTAIIHALANMSEIRKRSEAFWQHVLDKDWCQAGWQLGDLKRFVWFWDFSPTAEDLHDLSFLE
jgi:hypothetical protein